MKPISGIELVDQSIKLLRSKGRNHLSTYYIGTIPCILYFLYFFHDMSQNPYAADNLGFSSAILSLTFLWMKMLQALFGMRMYESLVETDPVRLSTYQWIQCFFWQAFFAPLGILLIPLALVLSIPFGWVYAFFQNVTFAPLLWKYNQFSQSLEMARLWPKQNHIMLWVTCPVMLLTVILISIFTPAALQFFQNFSIQATLIIVLAFIIITGFILNPFGGLLFANIGAVFLAIPELIRILFGIQLFQGSYSLLMLHPAFLITVWGMCFLLLDPIVKTAYIIRIYNAETQHTGHDLLLKLKAPVIAVLLLFLCIPQTSSSTEQLHQKQLDTTIKKVLEKPSYAWKDIKKTKLALSRNFDRSHFLFRFARSIKKAALRVKDYLKPLWEKIFGNKKDKNSKLPPAFDFSINPNILLLFLLFTLLIAGILWKNKKNRDTNDSVPGATDTKTSAPEEDLNTISADKNSHDIWEDIAQQFFNQGNFKEAIRHLYLSTLSYLGTNCIIVILKYRTNREYLLELKRKFPDKYELNSNFESVIHTYENVWFGSQTASNYEFESIHNSYSVIKRVQNSYA